MRNGEILQKFMDNYPSMKNKMIVYRPLCLDFVKDRVGVNIWLENGDILLYFPKIIDNSAFISGQGLNDEAVTLSEMEMEANETNNI